MPAGPSRRMRVVCKGCGSENIRYRRYKCLRCLSYDLCGQCLDSFKAAVDQVANPPHTAIHPFQRVLTPEEKEIYLQSGVVDYEWSDSFGCPCCLRVAMGKFDLLDHLVEDHFHLEGDFPCPVCVNKCERDDRYCVEDLVSHLLVDHCRRTSDEDDDESDETRPISSTAASNVLAPNGRRTAANSHQRMELGNPGNSSTGSGPQLHSFAQDAHNVAASLLVRYGNALRRSNLPLLSADARVRAKYAGLGNTAEDAASVSLYSDMASFTDDDDDDDCDNRDASADDCGNEESAAAAAFSQLLSLEKDEDRGLLQSVFNAKLTEEEKIAIDVERANRSLFLQELLLSPLTKAEEPKKSGKPSPAAGQKKANSESTKKKKRNVLRAAVGGKKDAHPAAETNGVSSIADRSNSSNKGGGKCCATKLSHNQYDLSSSLAQRAAAADESRDGVAVGGGDGHLQVPSSKSSAR